MRGIFLLLFLLRGTINFRARGRVSPGEGERVIKINDE